MEIRNKLEVDYCFYITEKDRKEFTRPYGLLFVNNKKLLNYLNSYKTIISVGDYVTQLLVKSDLIPDIAIIDMKTKRNQLVELNINKFSKIIKIKNEPGVIRYSTLLILKELIANSSSNKNIAILVDGEEDVLVLPISLYAESDTAIIYGQPNAGSVIMEINKYNKWRAYDLFSKLRVKKC